MKINEIIRKYRKEQNLTQEQVANYLGVTAPAVNKWENAISYPDITLLAPLARILKINMDTLLSFNEELTQNEINQIVGELSEIMKTEGYEKVFAKGEAYIKDYPNCDMLILSIAQILNAYLTIMGIEDRQRYEFQIAGWFEIASNSKDTNVSSMAWASLCQHYMAKEEYEKAQNLLDQIPPLGYDKSIDQAVLFAKQGENPKAYEVFEKMLYQGANRICNTLQWIVNMLSKEKKFEDAYRYAEIENIVAELFDLGSYNAYTPYLFLAIEERDKEKTITMIEKMIEGLSTIGDFRNSSLYSHVKFGESGNTDGLKRMIKKSLESDQELDFVREEAGFKKMIRRLEE